VSLEEIFGEGDTENPLRKRASALIFRASCWLPEYGSFVRFVPVGKENPIFSLPQILVRQGRIFKEDERNTGLQN